MSIYRFTALRRTTPSTSAILRKSNPSLSSLLLLGICMMFNSQLGMSQCQTNGGFETQDYAGWTVKGNNDFSSVECSPVNVDSDNLDDMMVTGSCFSFHGITGSGSGSVSNCFNCFVPSCGAELTLEYQVAHNLQEYNADIENLFAVNINSQTSSETVHNYTALADVLETGSEIFTPTIDLVNYSCQAIEICMTTTVPAAMPGAVMVGFDNVSYTDMECDPVELLCISQLNISLDQACTALVLPSTVLANSVMSPSDYAIVLFDEHHDVVPDNLLTLDQLGTSVTYEIFDTACNPNSCWGTITVENKVSPILNCPDLILSCAQLNFLPPPSVTGGTGCLGDGGFDVFLANEERTKLECDTTFTHFVTRTYQATDNNGTSSTCVQEIKLTRIDFDKVEFPQGTTNISCSDSDRFLIVDGVPLPWISDSTAAGMGTGGLGLPYLIYPNTGSGTGSGFPGFSTGSGSGSGMFGFGGTGSGTGSGIPLIPNGGATFVDDDGVVQVEPGTNLCSSWVTYTDLKVPGNTCRQKVFRTWEILEWFCGTEISYGPSTQIIEVIDDVPPTFDCPTEEITLNSNHDCGGEIIIPGLENIEDRCDNGTNVVVFTPIDSIQTNGGLVNLTVGPNLVTYVVSDDCYNSASCQVTINVRDLTEPVAICEQSTVVSISNNGSTFAYAATFDDGSWDECGLDRFEVSRPQSNCTPEDLVFDKYVSFCCDDVGTDVMVFLRVFDLGGNFSDCMIMVSVQDNDPPSITCPEDMTVGCDTVYDETELSATFGAASVIDNCAATSTVDESAITDINQCGIGQITRTFTVFNSTVTCKQEITFEDQNLFMENEIVWPSNFSATDQGLCQSDLDPTALALPYSYPTFPTQDQHCVLLGYDFEDTSTVGAGGCITIKRKWTVIDWCNKTGSQFNTYEMDPPQELTISRTTVPTIQISEPLVIVPTQTGNCQFGQVNIEVQAMTCVEAQNWSWVITDSSGAKTTGNTSVVAGSYEKGLYNIDWTLEDGCGNVVSASQLFEVKDLPQAVCTFNVFEVNTLLTPAIIANPTNPCATSNTVSMQFPTGNDTLLVCGQLGSISLPIYLTDIVTGNTNVNNCVITVVDNNNFCTTTSGNMLAIQGSIYTEDFQTIENVEVMLADNMPMAMTDQDGNYAFDAMPQGGAYEVTPINDENYLNGVSTLDLILIQRHILGIEKFDTPYKYLAADVDDSHTLNGVDLVELRKLILGLYDDLPNNTSWRFVDSEYNFSNALDPWATVIAETYAIEDLSSDMAIDFIGVKIGDVNSDVEVSSIVEDIDVRSQRWPVALSQNLTSLEAGDISTITITGENYERVSGWQGTINFDQTSIRFLSIKSGVLGITEEQMNFNNLDKGMIAISYHNDTEQEFSANEILFEIEVEAIASVDAQQLFRVTSDMIRAEAYRGYAEVVPFTDSAIMKEGSKILSVYPNPFAESTTIEFEISQEGEAEWEFYDSQGRLIFNNERYYHEGHHTLMIDEADLDVKGVIYIKLKTADDVSEFKMIRL